MWDMVGSAVEYAADHHKRIHDEEIYHFVNDSDQACQPAAVSFKSKFLDSEADEEQTSALTTVIETLYRKYQDDNFQASEVATYAGKAEDYAIAFKDALEHAAGKPIKIISSTTVSWRLKALVGAPVKLGSKILVLKYNAEHQGGNFRVETVDEAA
jgi:hypothetical protein